MFPLKIHPGIHAFNLDRQGITLYPSEADCKNNGGADCRRYQGCTSGDCHYDLSECDPRYGELPLTEVSLVQTNEFPTPLECRSRTIYFNKKMEAKERRAIEARERASKEEAKKRAVDDARAKAVAKLVGMGCSPSTYLAPRTPIYPTKEDCINDGIKTPFYPQGPCVPYTPDHFVHLEGIAQGCPKGFVDQDAEKRARMDFFSMLSPELIDLIQGFGGIRHDLAVAFGVFEGTPSEALAFLCNPSRSSVHTLRITGFHMPWDSFHPGNEDGEFRYWDSPYHDWTPVLQAADLGDVKSFHFVYGDWRSDVLPFRKDVRFERLQTLHLQTHDQSICNTSLINIIADAHGTFGAERIVSDVPAKDSSMLLKRTPYMPSDLVHLDLSGSTNLITFDVEDDVFPSLKTLILAGCTDLKSFAAAKDGGLSALVELSLKRCTALKYLQIPAAPNLQRLALEGCIALESLDIEDDSLNKLGCLNLSDSARLKDITIGDRTLHQADTIKLHPKTTLHSMHVGQKSLAELTRLVLHVRARNRERGLSSYIFFDEGALSKLSVFDVSGDASVEVILGTDPEWISTLGSDNVEEGFKAHIPTLASGSLTLKVERDGCPSSCEVSGQWKSPPDVTEGIVTKLGQVTQSEDNPS
jgi:hypothetical protein